MYAKIFIEPALARSAQRCTAAWVERRSNLHVTEFETAYLRARRPVVLTDVLREWQALRVFTPNFFRQRFGNVPVAADDGAATLGEVIDRQLATPRENPGRHTATLADCTELLPFVTPRFACSLPSRHAQSLLPADVFDETDRLEIRFDGPGGKLSAPQCQPLHLHAWIAQVHGEREIVLYEHGQEQLLYLDPKQPWRSTVCDADDHAEYPLLARVRGHRVVLRPGDALFIPAGTWYSERCRGPSIAIAFGQLEASNWDAFVAEVIGEQRRHGRPLRALAYGAWLRLIGPVLRAAEWLGAGRDADWGCDGSTGWKAARRCPAHRL